MIRDNIVHADEGAGSIVFHTALVVCDSCTTRIICVYDLIIDVLVFGLLVLEVDVKWLRDSPCHEIVPELEEISSTPKAS